MPKTAAPFSWTVRFTVDPLWVADGFTLSDERALHMLAKEIGGGSSEELQASVLVSPLPADLVRMQGYVKGTQNYRHEIKELREGTPDAKRLRLALLAAHGLLDSVAFVNNPGDTNAVLSLLQAALDLTNPRRGSAVMVDD